MHAGIPVLGVSIFAAMSLAATLLNSAFALFVLLKNPHGTVNRLWSLSIACLVLWGIGEFIMRVTPDVQTALVVNSICGVGYTILPSFFLNFTLEFSGHSPRGNKWMYLLIFFPGIVFSILQFVGFITTAIYLPTGFCPTPYRYYFIYICWVEIWFTWGLYLCYERFRSMKLKQERYQALFLLIGVLIPIVLAGVVDVFLPFLGIQTLRLGTVASTATAAVVTYAVHKFQLMSLTPATTARFIIDAMQDIVVVTDMDGYVLFSNISFRREVSDFLPRGMHIRDFIEEGGNFVESLRDSTASAGRTILFEKKCRRANGKTFEALISVSGVEDRGETIGLVFLVQDITEKKRLEASAFRSQRLDSLGTLASGIAHDLNNVLTPILLAVERLKANSGDELNGRLVDILEANTRRGAALVKQILTFSRGTMGEAKDVRINDLIKATCDIMEETFPKSIQIVLDLPAEPIIVHGDETQLSQVVLNLAVNARDAMPSGGLLSIGVERVEADEGFIKLNPDAKSGSYAAITVSDSGTGIASEIIDKIFDPFFTTKEIGKGTGIGLSTVARILKTHNGFVNIYSEPGKGSSFKVYLPASGAKADVKLVAAQRPPGKGEYILIVDDEPSVRSVTQFVLESRGYKTLLAENGLEGVELFRKNTERIAAVVMDNSMPGMDGFEAANEIRKIDPNCRIIMQSGLPSSDKSESSPTGSVFLPKPFTEQQLLQTLHQVIAGSR